jgi:hypothetical protein
MLTAKEGFPELRDAVIALIRASNVTSKTIDAMANHMRESLGGVITLAECIDNASGRTGCASPPMRAFGNKT